MSVENSLLGCAAVVWLIMAILVFVSKPSKIEQQRAAMLRRANQLSKKH